jgi:CDP-diacylglycerol--serine O-phosphatidyltransferase
MSVKNHIPNFLTCCNLACGCIAIVLAFQGNLIGSSYLVGAAVIFDFFDGFVARLLKVSGELGKQLDSLADMVSFGVLPGVIMYQLLSLCVIRSTLSDFDLFAAFSGDVQSHSGLPWWLPLLGFLITIFSGLRLAKFNIDSRQSDSFIGIPTPANTILICSLPLILDLHAQEGLNAVPGLSAIGTTISSLAGHTSGPDFILTPLFLISLTILMSFLMVAELPLFALKFKGLGWQKNKLRYCFLLMSGALLIIFKYMAIPIIIFLYVLLSILNNLLNSYRNEVQG